MVSEWFGGPIRRPNGRAPRHPEPRRQRRGERAAARASRLLWDRSRPGFTLTEMLVVLSVIVILAALLFPAFAQLRARARQTACASHLAQIARAGMLYAQDYDERFPSCYSLPTPPYSIDPATTLQPYIQNWALFYCPERHTVLDGCLDPANNFRPHSRCMGYGYNWGSGLGYSTAVLKGDGLVRWNGRADVGVTLAEVVAPTHCFFYGDSNDHDFLTLLRETMPGAGQPDGRFEPPRHSAGNNFAFVDGHVEWLPFPGGVWIDGGPWVVPDMSMYSRTGQWEAAPVP